jgi:hypothetical protein
MWMFPREIFMFYNVLGVVESLAICQNFVIDPMDLVVFLDTFDYIR